MQLSKSKISDSEESFHISVRSPGAYNLEPPLPAMKFPSGDSLLEQGLSGGRGGSNSSRSNKVGNTAMMRLAAILTFMQFLFAMYATFLLYYLSPSVPDLMAQPDASWASQIVKLFPSRVEGSDAYFVNHNGLPKRVVCQSEEIDFSQKKSTNTKIVELKTTLFREVMDFQHKKRGCETLQELMATPSSSSSAKVTVILNHYQRRTLCAQLDALLEQTLPFYNVWVVAFGSPQEDNLRAIVEAYNNSNIQFIGSTHDFKYYGRFQLALQAEESDFVYLMDDDMIPGKKMLQILAHVGGTEKYRNAVLGSIGRILPFKQKDESFPSYRKFGSKEAGLYLPDPAYDIIVDRIVKVDFLSSSWFLSTHLVKTIFTETPFTFSTGEDLHLSYQLQKYRDAASYVLPVDANDTETWGDKEHRLAQIAETTVIHKNVVEVRDNQWWRAFTRGYITQWAEMNPQQSDAIFYAHTLEEVKILAPLLFKFRHTPGKKAYMVVSGGEHCPCGEAADVLGWAPTSCLERRFRLFDLELGAVHRSRDSPSLILEIYVAMRGLINIHSPTLLITVDNIATPVLEALQLAVSRATVNTTLVQLPQSSVSHMLWMADIESATLKFWNKMRIRINIITQNRSRSLLRLLRSLKTAHYVGDIIDISFNMDSRVDTDTLRVIDDFEWPHGTKHVRRRIIQGGLIRAVSESWYPASDDDFGLLLEDDIEVSPFYYMWLKYALLTYHYDPTVNLPELNSIALYSPRVIEIVKERPHWNATDFFSDVHPNTPYLHQLPCSWGALFFPKRWREFYKYMGMRFTEDAKANPVQIPKSRTNGWQASWKKFLIDLMYLRGHVTLYPNFPNQTSFSTNHMEPGAHIAAADNVIRHDIADFEVPLLQQNFVPLLPQGKLPSALKLPVINLFNQASSLRGLKAAGAKLGQDVLQCNLTMVVRADDTTGEPLSCIEF